MKKDYHLETKCKIVQSLKRVSNILLRDLGTIVTIFTIHQSYDNSSSILALLQFSVLIFVAF